MRIAIASGKGGTGKTTISTSLARMLSRRRRVQYLDCDVEEPNGSLFLHPVIELSAPVEIAVPEVDDDKCTHCGACSRLCAFHAIVCLPKATLTFPELCHGCGGCARICPAGAITEVGRSIGVLERGTSGSIDFVHGRLNVGEAMSPPLIRAVTDCADDSAVVILDAPPGTSCPVVASLRSADRVVLVSEPTPFGLHDLALAVELVRELAVPCGVFINRSDIGDDRVEVYCREQGLPVWGRLPHDRRVAEAYSVGQLVLDAVPGVEAYFDSLIDAVFGEQATCARS